MVVIEKKLYEASLSGSVDSLNELMKEDKLTLTRFCITSFDETPLHIAAMLGHLHFATALLSLMPELVTELDSRRSSPLHLASVKGYVEIVKKLLMVNSDVCLLRDEDGRTPLHLAVMRGRVEVINELVQARPEAIQYKLDRGETLLHSCVKYNRFEALKLLVQMRRVDDDLINAKDDDGNTILHLATALKLMETIKYLLSRTGVKVNAVNENGFTALDITQHMPRDLKSMEIHEFLRNAGALRARSIPASARDTNQVIKESEISQLVVNCETPSAQKPSRGSSTKEKPLKLTHEDWLAKKRDALMVAATVIASMAYQGAMNPPRGLFDSDLKDANDNIVYYAGSPRMAYQDPNGYVAYHTCNSLAFVASLSTVLLLLSGLPLKRKIVIWILMAAMWVTIIFVALAYLMAISPPYVEDQVSLASLGVAGLSLLIWMGICVIVFLAHIIRCLVWCVRKLLKLRKKQLSSDMTEGQGPANA